MARRFGEAPGQTRTSKGGRLTAAERKRRRTKSNSKDSLMRLPGNVAKYYKDNPKMLAEDVAAGIPGLSGIAIGRKVSRGDNADAALSAAALVPGVGIAGKGAKAASVASKASKAAAKAATKSTAKKTTKKTTKKTSTPVKKAAKKVTKKSTSRSTPKPPVKPKSMIEKQRARDRNKIKQATEAAKRKRNPRNPEAPPRSAVGRPKDSELLTPQEIADKAATKRFGDLQRLRKSKTPQPKRDKIRTDAPGEKTPVASRVTKPRYTAKGPTNQTKAGYKPYSETPDEAPTARQLATADTSPDAARRAEAMKALKGKKLGRPGSQVERATKARDKSVAKRKKAEKTKESQDVAAGKDNNRTGTPLEKTREDARYGRMKAAGGKRPHAKGMKDDYARSETALTGQKLDPSIEGKSRGAITSSLKKKGSATKKARKTIGNKAKEGKASESEVQSKAVLDDASPRKASEREAKKLARGPRKKDGQATAAPGAINPPRNVKASDGVRKTEPRFKTTKGKRADTPTEKKNLGKSSGNDDTAKGGKTGRKDRLTPKGEKVPEGKQTPTPPKFGGRKRKAKMPDYATGRTKDSARKTPFGPPLQSEKKTVAKKATKKSTPAKPKSKPKSGNTAETPKQKTSSGPRKVTAAAKKTDRKSVV